MTIQALLLGWTALLAFVSLVLWRDVRILEARIEPGGSLVANGIEIGSPAPRVARAAAARTVVFLTDACDVCLDVASDLGRVRDLLDLTVVVGDTGGDRAALLATLPGGPRVVVGDEARAWEREFDVRVAPFAVVLDDGLVAGKGHLRGAADVDRLSARKAGLS
jgi:hypothetical protein